MGAKEHAKGEVLSALDEKVVKLLERISAQLATITEVLRHGAPPIAGWNPQTLPSPDAPSQAKSDSMRNFSDESDGKDEIPSISGGFISGFGEDA